MGYSRHEAIHKIGTVVIKEIWNVLKKKEHTTKKDIYPD